MFTEFITQYSIFPLLLLPVVYLCKKKGPSHNQYLRIRPIVSSFSSACFVTTTYALGLLPACYLSLGSRIIKLRFVDGCVLCHVGNTPLLLAEGWSE